MIFVKYDIRNLGPPPNLAPPLLWVQKTPCTL